MTTPWVSPREYSPVIAVLGPTNTGKTHFAVERMLAHSSGMIGFPLRLLAREIYDRVVAERGPRATALITGEEKIIPDDPRYFICTVEAMPLSRQTEFLAIDEIQLAADPDRGHIFTQRILGARGISETVLLGSHTAEHLVRKLLPQCEIRTSPRLSRLSYAGPRKISRLPPRTAVVAFSAEDVHDIATALRRRRGGCAIVMGALSPRTRNAQVALYQSGDVDFLVATDAIGMGLNMDIDHVAFAKVSKFDGRQSRRLTDSEIGQIAGRAGRYSRDGTFGVTGQLSAFDQPLIDALEGHEFPLLRSLQWRNGRPDTATLDALLRGLDDLPPDPVLVATRDAVDHMALKQLAGQRDIARNAADSEGVALLWDVCQIPDFAQVGLNSHIRLLARIFTHLREDGALPVDWFANHIAKLERTGGDIGVLMERIARIRTWTYLAHHGDWVPDAAHWQERARSIEDLLSDALHDRLTDQFVDPYAVTSGRRRRKQDEDVVAYMRDGAIWVGTERIGGMAGLGFTPDPDSGLEPDGMRRRTAGYGDTALARAARRALREGMPGWVDGIVDDGDDAFKLGVDGALRWAGSEIAHLKSDREILAPAIQLTGGDTLEPAERDRLVTRLKSWLDSYLRSRLAPLYALRDAELSSHARGLAFQLVDGLGVVARDKVRGHLAELKTERKTLRDAGVNFGRYAVSLPALAKPEAVRVRAVIWCVHHQKPIPNLPARRGRSVPADPAAPDGFYAAVGYVCVARRVIPVWLFDRLADAAASALRRGRLTASPQLAAYADLTLAEVREMLRILGYRLIQDSSGAHFVPGWGRGESRSTRPKGTGDVKPKGRRTPARQPGGSEGPEAIVPADAAATPASSKGKRYDARKPKRSKAIADGDSRPIGKGSNRPPRRESIADPDSPFAVLKVLKQSMTKGQ